MSEINETNETIAGAETQPPTTVAQDNGSEPAGFMFWLRRSILPLVMLVGLVVLVAANITWFMSPMVQTPSSSPLVAGSAATSPLIVAATPAPELITVDEMASRYGIEVTLLAVTALGGVVDFRFRVLDGPKVNSFLKDANNMPMVMMGTNESDEALRGPNMMGGMEFKEGKVYYFHYANAGGKVKPGASLGVMFGQVIVGPIVVQ